MQRSNYQGALKVLVVVEASNGRRELTAFDEHVRGIIASECGSSMEEKLLSAPILKFIISGKIVREIKK